MARKNGSEQPEVETDQPVKKHYVIPIDSSLPAVSLKDKAAALGVSGPRVPAENLVDQTFIIIKAKAYDSSFDDNAHVYFCTCKDVQTGEVFTTSLGGAAVVDLLDQLALQGNQEPIVATLRKVEGGKYGGYYTLE